MALIKCPECGKEISGRASACPNCGYPIQEHVADPTEYRVIAYVGESIKPKVRNFIVQSGKLPEVTLVFCKSGFITEGSYTRETASSIVTRFKELGITAIAVRSDEAEAKSMDAAPPPEIRCPYCGSTNIQIAKKGFSAGGAALGAFLLGPIGVLGGAVGANDVERVCVSCGRKLPPSF